MTSPFVNHSAATPIIGGQAATATRSALVSVGARAGAKFHTMHATAAASSDSGDDGASSSFASASASFASASYGSGPGAFGSTGGAPGSDDASAAGASSTQLMRFRIPRPEHFYFSRGDSVCRLCSEYVPEKLIKFHLVGAGPRGPSTHMGREIVLDSLVHYAKMGFDPRQVMRSWPHTLMSSPLYARLPALLPRDICDLGARCGKVRELLHSLARLGVLDVSISPHSDAASARTDAAVRQQTKRRIAFERLECVGDNAWGSNIAGRMMLIFADKRWHHCNMYHSFNVFRDLAETNTNLERMFEVLQLASLLPPASKALVGDGKIKADIFEAIMGELVTMLYAHESNMLGVEEYTELNDEHLAHVCLLIRHVLSEIFDLTLLVMVFGLAELALPIARELAQQALVAQHRPALDTGDAVRTRRPQYHHSFVPTFNIPARLGLSPGPRQVPAIGACGLSWTPAAANAASLAAARAAASSPPTSSSSPEASVSLAAGELVRLAGPAFNATPRVRPRLDRGMAQLVARLSVTAAQGGAGGGRALGRGAFDADAHHRDFALASEVTSIPRPATNRRFAPIEIPPLLDQATGAHGSRNRAEAKLAAELLHSGGRSRFRAACPFRLLSKYPPQAYNPYGLPAAAWMRRWLRPADGECTRAARSMFHEDVIANVNIVLAQFEATAHLRRDRADDAAGATAADAPDCGGAHMTSLERLAEATVSDLVARHRERDDLEGAEPVCGGAGVDPAAVGGTASVADTVTSSTAAAAAAAAAAAGALAWSDLAAPRHVRLIYREVLELVHPFQDGLTVGSEGASVGSLSSAIAALTLESHAHSSVAAASSAAAVSGTAVSGAGGGATTVTGDIDIEEIKRRNLALRKSAPLSARRPSL